MDLHRSNFLELCRLNRLALTSADEMKVPGGDVSGRTKDIRSWTLVKPQKAPAIEKKQIHQLLPASKEVKNGLMPVMVSKKRLVGRKGKRAKGKRHRGVVPSLPPQIGCVVTCSHRFRFQNSSTQTTTGITFGNLAGALGCVGTVTNSTVVALASSIKIRRVTIWPAEAAPDSRCEIVWNIFAGMPTKDESKLELLPYGMTTTGPVISTPPKGDARGWLTATSVGGTSAVIFTLYMQQGSILDLDVSWTLSNNIGGVSISGLTTVVLGTVYYLALDGHTNTIAPQGVPTTA